MIIRKASEFQIRQALNTANEKFDGNLRFKTFQSKGNTRQGLPKFSVTLTVHSSKEAGARRSHRGSRMAAACWHAHGVFVDSLPAGAEVETIAGKRRPGEPWQDWNAGSEAYPVRMSELCDCRGIRQEVSEAEREQRVWDSFTR